MIKDINGNNAFNDHNILTENNDSYKKYCDNTINISGDVILHYDDYKKFSNNLKEQPRDPISNGSKRSILEQRAKANQHITIYGLVVSIYEEDWIDRESGECFTMLTMVNINYTGKFIADHIQLKVPYKMFEPYMVGSILCVVGKVYEYKSNNETKYSIEAIKIRDAYNKPLNVQLIYDFYPNIEHFENEEMFINYRNAYFKDEDIFYQLELSLDLIDKIIDIKGFISSYILNQYLINSNPEILNNSLKEQLKVNRIMASDLTLLILYLIYRINKDKIKSITEIFTIINGCLNGIHFMNKDHLNVKSKRNYKKDVENHRRFKNETCVKLNVIPDKAYRYILNRNSNFETFIIDPMEIVKGGFAILYSEEFYYLLEAYQVEL